MSVKGRQELTGSSLSAGIQEKGGLGNWNYGSPLGVVLPPAVVTMPHAGKHPDTQNKHTHMYTQACMYTVKK